MSEIITDRDIEVTPEIADYADGVAIEFGMWLTTRSEVIKVGASETVYAMNDALTEFIKMRHARLSK